MSAQAPTAVILIRAERFLPNPVTAADNAFQADVPHDQSAETTHARALAEMDAVAEALRGAGVGVHVFADADHSRPDSVFPNNWLSTHAGGMIAVYPMYASNRRHERRADVLEFLKSRYRVQTIVDYSGLEPDGIFLEGTGAMVLDHISRVAYTARSHRADSGDDPFTAIGCPDRDAISRANAAPKECRSGSPAFRPQPVETPCFSAFDHRRCIAPTRGSSLSRMRNRQRQRS